MADKTQQSNNKQLEALSAAINDLERKAQHVGTMSQSEKNALASALLEAIFNGLDLDSAPLLNMAVRRFKIMVEHGAWETEFMGKIKAVCMVALRKNHILLLTEIVAVYQPILLNNPDLKEEGINDLGMIACLAIKNSYDDIGNNCVKIILMLDKETLPEENRLTDQTLKILKNILITATRARNEDIFCFIMNQITNSYKHKEFLPDSTLLLDFYLAVLFAAADYRCNDGLIAVNRFLDMFHGKKILNISQKKKIAYECVQLIGQMARRNWTETAQQLMWFFFAFVKKDRDIDVIAYSVSMMSSSLKMHATWDSFESAFTIYYPWQLAMLVLVDMFYKDSANKNVEKLEVARLVLRNMRDLVLHVSRLAINKPETEAFNQWFDLWEKSKAPKHVRFRAQKFMQLTVLYWEELQPKASRNQMPHLIRIFQPNLIDARGKLLLAE